MGTSNSSNYLKGLSVILFLTGLISAPISATAASLSFVPSEQTVNLGNQVTVDVIFSNPADTLVGAYDFFVNYDAEVLAFDPDDLTFGSGLGGPTNAIQGPIEPLIGRFNVAELSFVQDLTPLQDGTTDLLLFSVTFDTIKLGPAQLTLIGGIDPNFEFIGDELGDAIDLDNIGTGVINVVPIPAAAWLMGSALVGLLGFGHKRWRSTTV